MLFLLGIDTLFAHIEAAATVLTDTPRFRHVRKESVAAMVCALGFVVSLAFASSIGHALIDTFDHYVVSYGLFFTGALEAYTVSWGVGVAGHREEVWLPVCPRSPCLLQEAVVDCESCSSANLIFSCYHRKRRNRAKPLKAK